MVVKVFFMSTLKNDVFWPSFVTDNQVNIPEIWPKLRRTPLIGCSVAILASLMRSTFLICAIPIAKKVVLVDHKPGIWFELAMLKVMLATVRIDLTVTIQEITKAPQKGMG